MDAYESRYARLVEDLINTYDVSLTEPERLGQPEDLARFLAAHGVLYREPLGPAELGAVRAVRHHARQAFEAEDEAVAADLVNALFDHAAVVPRLVVDGGSWRIQLAVEPALPLTRRIAVEAALGLSALLQHYGLARLRVCAALPCRDVFVDRSRNASRRYCSDRCANRHNAAAFRERQRGADA